MAPTHDALLLELVGELQGMLDLDEFRNTLIHALRRALPSDFVSLNALGPEAGDVWFLAIPDPPPEVAAPFAELVHTNPLVERLRRTQDGRAYRFSDVVTREELHGTALYQRVYRALGVEYQIAITLPSRPGHLLGIALSRGRRDYSDDERDLLNRARPYLIQAYRNVQAFGDLRAAAARHDPAAVVERLQEEGLTPREAEVVRLVALGHANHAAAAALGVSVRTVHKHLERAFRKLAVSSRSEAAAHVWNTH